MRDVIALILTIVVAIVIARIMSARVSPRFSPIDHECPPVGILPIVSPAAGTGNPILAAYYPNAVIVA